ncbi:expressed protein [Echinococcus multilocularis]|uniref:Expressed protein n=1 Tax=Echinococcus multilocularis TaxID=6211 RepID=A0A087VXX7_ECHMU|nr:expressed protein [Echinococcus multilocularis]
MRDFIGRQCSRRTRIDGIAREIRWEQISLRSTKNHSLPLHHYSQRVVKALDDRKHKAWSRVGRRWEMGSYRIANDDESIHARRCG